MSIHLNCRNFRLMLPQISISLCWCESIFYLFCFPEKSHSSLLKCNPVKDFFHPARKYTFRNEMKFYRIAMQLDRVSMQLLPLHLFKCGLVLVVVLQPLTLI